MTQARPHDMAAIKGVLENCYQAWDAGNAGAFVTDSTAIDQLGTVRFPGENAAVAVSEAGIRFPGETEVPECSALRTTRRTWSRTRT